VMSWIRDDRPALTLRFAGTLLQFEAPWLPYREARSWLEPAIETARKLLEDKTTDIQVVDFIRALQTFGWLLVTHGDMTAGLSILDETIRLAREFDEFRLLTFAIGMKAQAMGSTVTQDVMLQIEEVIALARRNAADHELELVMVLFSAGQAYLAQGHVEKGQAYITEAIQPIAKYDIPFFKSWAYYAQASMALAAGNNVEAEKYFLMSVEANEKWGNLRLAATGRSELAHVYRREGRLDEAEACYGQTIISWQEQGHQSAVAHQLECFAYIAIARGRHEHAARLIACAQAHRKRLNAVSTDPREIAELEQALAQLAEALGEDERDRVMAAGKMMSLDDAVLLALKETTIN